MQPTKLKVRSFLYSRDSYAFEITFPSGNTLSQAGFCSALAALAAGVRVAHLYAADFARNAARPCEDGSKRPERVVAWAREFIHRD